PAFAPCVTPPWYERECATGARAAAPRRAAALHVYRRRPADGSRRKAQHLRGRFDLDRESRISRRAREPRARPQATGLVRARRSTRDRGATRAALVQAPLERHSDRYPAGRDGHQALGSHTGCALQVDSRLVAALDRGEIT